MCVSYRFVLLAAREYCKDNVSNRQACSCGWKCNAVFGKRSRCYGNDCKLQCFDFDDDDNNNNQNNATRSVQSD